MTRVWIALVCDGCQRVYQGVGDDIAALRTLAQRDDGWECDALADLCPDCQHEEDDDDRLR